MVTITKKCDLLRKVTVFSNMMGYQGAVSTSNEIFYQHANSSTALYINGPRKYDPDIQKQAADDELVLQKAKEKCHISPIFTQLTAIVPARVDVSGELAARGRTCKYLASVQPWVLAAVWGPSKGESTWADRGTEHTRSLAAVGRLQTERERDPSRLRPLHRVVSLQIFLATRNKSSPAKYREMDTWNGRNVHEKCNEFFRQSTLTQ